MRVDKVEFEECLRPDPNRWSPEHQEELERHSLIRIFGEKILENRDGFPVIPEHVHHNRYVITSTFPGTTNYISVDVSRCVFSTWNNIFVQRLGSADMMVPQAENVFLSNFLSFADLETKHIHDICDAKDMMSSGNPRTILLLPSNLGNVPEVQTILGPETYQVYMMRTPSSHPSHFKSQGYLIMPGTICYESTSIEPSPDGLSVSWMIRLIIASPSLVKRFVLTSP